MNIVICDDELIYRQSIHEKVDNWAMSNDHSAAIMVYEFQSSEDMLDEWEHGLSIDMILNYSPYILQRRRNTKATAMNGSNRSKAAALLLCACDPMKKERTNPLAQKTVSNRLSRCSGFIFARPECFEAFVEILAGMDNCC